MVTFFNLQVQLDTSHFAILYSYTVNHDNSRFKFVLFADQITDIGNEITV